jgi:hypothetical protein
VAVGYTATYEAEVLAMLDYLCNVDQSRLAASHLRSWILTGVTTPGMFRCEGLEGGGRDVSARVLSCRGRRPLW